MINDGQHGTEVVFNVAFLMEIQKVLVTLDNTGAVFNGAFELNARMFDVRYNEEESEYEVVIRIP